MIRIRPIDSNELGVVATLARRIWPTCYANILAPEQITNLLERIYTVDNLSNEMKSGHRFFIAENSNEAVGYASSYQEGSVLWLKKLYVLPQLQGQGLGKQLMDTAIAAFPSANELRLLVNRANLPAQQFYLRRQFIKIDEVAVQMGDHHFIDLVFSKKIER